MKYVLTFALLCYSFYLGGQNNPFDVRHTKSDTSVTPTIVPSTTKSSSKNVFDVVRNDEIDSPAMTSQDTPKAKKGNPFDVSHVPLRASKLKKEATALNVSSSGNNTSPSSNTFIFWLTLLSGILLAVVINTNRKLIPKIVRSIPNENILKSSQRDEKGGLSIPFMILYASFFINAAILVYLVIKNLGHLSSSGFIFYLYLLIGLAGVYMIKHLLLIGLGWVYPISEKANLYSYSISVFNIFLGIIIIPFNLLIAFGPPSITTTVLYIVGGVIVILLILRSLRGLAIGVGYVQSNLFHFLLYLCAFEIVPVLLFIKWLV